MHISRQDNNDGIVTGNVSDLENVGQGHHLQKSPYLSYYTINFLPNFHKNEGREQCHEYIQLLSIERSSLQSLEINLISSWQSILGHRRLSSLLKT